MTNPSSGNPTPRRTVAYWTVINVIDKISASTAILVDIVLDVTNDLRVHPIISSTSGSNWKLELIAGSAILKPSKRPGMNSVNRSNKKMKMLLFDLFSVTGYSK